MKGGSDADIGPIVSLLTGGASLCIECIADETSIPTGHVVVIENAPRVCDACGTVRIVVRLM